MLLKLPASLKYPITVTELLKQPNDDIERFAPLFTYTYKTVVTEGDGLGNENQIEKSFPTDYKSELDGVLKSWRIRKGAVIRQPEYGALSHASRVETDLGIAWILSILRKHVHTVSNLVACVPIVAKI